MDVGRIDLESRGSDSDLDLPAKFAKQGLTFDDVLLVPAESAVLPNDVSTATRLTRTIALEIPVVSAAMDTVTEARMAIALASEQGHYTAVAQILSGAGLTPAAARAISLAPFMSKVRFIIVRWADSPPPACSATTRCQPP